jgi:hypothetical protein
VTPQCDENNGGKSGNKQEYLLSPSRMGLGCAKDL